MKEKKERPQIIGIDLGTSYSLASVYIDGKLQLIQNEIGEYASPSIISFFDNNEKIVGTFGKERIIKNQKIIYNSKRFIGRRFEDKQIKDDQKLLPYKLIEDKTKDKVKIKLEGLNNLEKDEYYPEEISGMILRKIKNDAEFYLNKEIKEVVITTPAYFNQLQRKATKQAAEIAGLKVRKIINEPTAAAIAYAHQCKNNLGKTNLIFDFGGGTLDLTLLDYSEKEFIYCKVLCSSGDTHLGGQDIDNKIYDKIIKKYEEQIKSFHSKYGYKDETIGKFRLLNACEKAKIILSELCNNENEKTKVKSTNIIVDSYLPTINIEYTLTEEELNEIIKDFFEARIKECLDYFFEKANVQTNEIENIIFVGGSSKLPKLKELIKDYFQNSNLKILSTIEPNEVVALGAGIIAGQMKGEKDFQKYKLFDVTSLSLGTNLIGDRVDVIIPKNTEPSITKKKIYYTTVDNQETISNKVYEGEGGLIKDNYLLADFEITNLTKRKKGETGIELAFELTKNFILNVTAKELERIDGKINVRSDTVNLEEPKNVFRLEEINEMRKFIDENYKSDWQLLFDGKYQERIIGLKNKLNNNEEKFEIQKEIVEVINEFLLNFKENKIEQKQNINYKIYSLYFFYYFYEIKNLFKYKENLDEKEIQELINQVDFEKKIEIIKEELKEITWEVIDIFSDNKLVYNFLRIIIIEILLMDVEYKLNVILDFSKDIVPEIKNYKKIIFDIDLNFLEYKSIINAISIDSLNSNCEICINRINKYEKKLEVKKFIIYFFELNNQYNEELNNKFDEETLKKCNSYINKYYDYDLTIDSPEIIKLNEISYKMKTNNLLNKLKKFELNLPRENVLKYIKMYDSIINGIYHGKKEYIGGINKLDDKNIDEDEKAYKNLDKREREILDIIHKAKNSILGLMIGFICWDLSSKLKALFKIVEVFKPERFYHAKEHFYKNDYEGMIKLVKGLFTNPNESPFTIKEFEEKIRDDFIINILNSYGKPNNA